MKKHRAVLPGAKAPRSRGRDAPASGRSAGLSPSRRVAHRVLCALEVQYGQADAVLERCLNETELDARDRALALELTNGVLRHQSTLDWRLNHVASRAMHRVPVPVRTALRLGAYQLLYLDRIPHSAAVNESVGIVSGGRQDFPQWSGFTNAVLRGLLREASPPFPDSSTDPVASLSLRYACPAWMVERWITRFGFKTAEELCGATLLVPPLTLRTNTLNTTRDQLLADLIEAGLHASPTPVSSLGITVEKHGPVSGFPYYAAGVYSIEDEAAQLVPPLLDPQPHDRVLDACAAPGGKATHLAALMQDRGEIIAVDRHRERLQVVRENAERLGVTSVSAIKFDWTKNSEAIPAEIRSAGPFDCILVDAPCSGLGVLKRHPEGKWQKQVALVGRHQICQLQILDRVAPLLRPNGRLVYSTCSTEPEENEHVIEQFCRSHSEFRQESVEPWLPRGGRFLLTSQGYLSTLTSMHSMDAFFACRLRKADY